MQTVLFTENVVEGGIKMFETMSTTITSLLEVAGSVLTWGIANPVISIPLTVGIVGCGFGLVHKALNLFTRV